MIEEGWERVSESVCEKERERERFNSENRRMRARKLDFLERIGVGVTLRKAKKDQDKIFEMHSLLLQVGLLAKNYLSQSQITFLVLISSFKSQSYQA